MNSLDTQSREWIEAYCNQTMDAETFSRFEQALSERADLRAALRAYLAMDANLRDCADVSLDAETAWSAAAPSQAKPLIYLPWIISTGLAALLLFGFFQFVQPDRSPKTAASEPAASGFGVLTGQDNAQWTSHPGLLPGDLLPIDRLELRAGVAQLELFSGVSLVIEGEAQLQIHSSMDVEVLQGKVRAKVPEPAKGFKLRMADGEVIDLGTEFAVDVRGGASEVHVIEGSVEWHPANQPEQHLMKEGQAISAKGALPVQWDAKRFIGEEEMRSRLKGGREDRRDAWLTASRALSRDARLVAYYPMSQPGQWQRTLFDASSQARDGAIVAARRATDRFGSTNAALDFSPTGSRVRINVDQPLSALTLMAWVRIDSLDRWYNSLLLTDGHELHEPHWQIMDDGRLFFSIRALLKPIKVDGEWTHKQVVYSPPVWSPEQAGQWMMLATTYDGSEVCHYRNGELIHREVLAEDMRVPEVKIGPASIGNWSEPMRNDPHFAVRNLNGCMDEFALFSEALKAEEIAALYASGRP